MFSATRTRSLGGFGVMVAAIAVSATVLVAPSSAAAPTSYVVSLPQGAVLGYAPSTNVLIPGQPLTFINADTTPHSVTSVDTKIKKIKFGKKTYITKVPIFDSKVISGTSTALVMGIETLKPGQYKYLCTLHTGMKGTLTIR